MFDNTWGFETALFENPEKEILSTYFSLQREDSQLLNYITYELGLYQLAQVVLESQVVKINLLRWSRGRIVDEIMIQYKIVTNFLINSICHRQKDNDLRIKRTFRADNIQKLFCLF